jgi:DNA-binding PadR family transcriptional regulator
MQHTKEDWEARGRRGPWGPPFGGHWRDHRRHGGRARRGDVRAAILALLAERPMHGYEVIRELSERTGGMWEPSPGSIYPTLQLLEDEGLVSVEESEGRKQYRLTDQGKAEAAQRSSSAAPWEQYTSGADPATVDLRRGVFQLLGAVKQVAETGTPEQVEKAQAILADARKRVYSILAEGE